VPARRLRRLLVLAALLLVAAPPTGGDPGAPAAAQAAAAKHDPPPRSHHARIEQRRAHAPRVRRARAARSGRLRFGIYPGGGAGLVHATGAARPEDPVLRLDALRRLRGDRQLVLHLYSSWTGDVGEQEAVDRALAEVRHYAAAGFAVEPVLRYRPARGADVAGFTAHVRAVGRELAAHRAVVAVQITNEANVPGAPDAADGAYPEARAALVRGVVAADQELRAARRADVRVGFNWAAAGDPGPADAFWRDLRRLGGRRFVAAVDWVGVDVYPGTWSGEGDHPRAVRAELERVLRLLRRTALPAAGLGPDVDLRISENGFPTGAARDEARQAMLLREAITTVDRLRTTYGITDYRWFDLRDAITGRPELEHGYGVLRDDYGEKPGFAVLAELIRRLGA